MNTLTPETVLIIDDDETIREYLHCILEEEGFTVFEAENGSEGTDFLVINKVNLIITDLIMPEKEGIETIREIKNSYPSCRIIAMSGAMNRDNYLTITKALGADAVIRKPFQRDELLATIAAIQHQ